RAGVDPGVGKRDVQPPVAGSRGVERAVQDSVITHVHDFAVNVEASGAQPLGLRGNATRIDIEHGDPGTVVGHGSVKPRPRPLAPPVTTTPYPMTENSSEIFTVLMPRAPTVPELRAVHPLPMPRTLPTCP